MEEFPMNNEIPNILFEKTEEYKRHRTALDKFRAMSPKAKLQTMIDAGILTSELTLTERYQSSSSEEAGDKENSAGSSLPQKKATQS